MNDIRIFSASQVGLITLVLNCLIPSHKNHPGARDPSIVNQIDNAISKSPNLKPIFLKSLYDRKECCTDTHWFGCPPRLGRTTAMEEPLNLFDIDVEDWALSISVD